MTYCGFVQGVYNLTNCVICCIHVHHVSDLGSSAWNFVYVCSCSFFGFLLYLCFLSLSFFFLTLRLFSNLKEFEKELSFNGLDKVTLRDVILGMSSLTTTVWKFPQKKKEKEKENIRINFLEVESPIIHRSPFPIPNSTSPHQFILPSSTNPTNLSPSNSTTFTLLKETNLLPLRHNLSLLILHASRITPRPRLLIYILLVLRLLSSCTQRIQRRKRTA